MNDIISFFEQYKTVSIILHVLSVVLGMGAALVSDILFSSYIVDKKINPTENRTLSLLSRVIWISLSLIVLTGIAIFFSNPDKYLHSAKFITKMSIVGVLIINGILFMKVTHQGLKKLNFTDTNINHKLVRVRKLSFAFGAVSMTSWLSAFVLGSLSVVPLSLPVLLGAYVAVLIVAIGASQILEYSLTHSGK
jgi:hypothetical protein